MSFAVIQTGGKQYKVALGDVITVEKLSGDFKAGDTVTFDEVLLTDDGKDTVIGTPLVSGVKVMGEFVENMRDKKISVIQFKSKSRYFKNKGHRQPHSLVKITSLK